MSPLELGRQLYDLLHLKKGDELVLYRDKITKGILVARQDRSDLGP